MSIRNRELSQFGSFIYIDDSTQSVGIATTPTPYVGIGTTNATHKLTVVGNTNILGDINVSGILTVGNSINASSFFLNGSPLVDAASEKWSTGTGNDIYRLGGNIGIGTSISSSKLTVSGNTDIDGNINATGVVNASRFISTVSTGTPPFNVSSSTLVSNLNADTLRGKTPPSGDIVGTTDIQILTNKTLTSPIISTIINGGTLTLPMETGTLVSTGSVGIVTSGMITDLSITNLDVAVGAGITYGKLSLTNSLVNADISPTAAIANSKLANSTISGVSLGSNLNDLSLGTYLSYNAGTIISGSCIVR